MDTYENFILKCRESMNKNGLRITSKQKTLIKAIYSLDGNFTPSDISKYTGSGFSIDKIIEALDRFVEDGIIFKVENENELTYSRVFNKNTNSKDFTSKVSQNAYDKDSSTLIEQIDNVSPVDYVNFEAKVIELINQEVDYENIYSHIQESYSNVEELSISKLINAYNLLNEGFNISSELKNYLSNPQFIETNPTLIVSLAKLYFHADKIDILDGQIAIVKEIVLPTIEEKTLDIDESKIISMVLKKIKYERLKDKDLEKINELKEYKEHEKLYELLIKAIESKYLLKQFDDSAFNMTKDELEKFLASK